MSGLSTATSNSMIDSIFGNASFSASILFGLSTTATTNGAGYTEPTDVNYARVTVTNNSTNFPAAVAKVKTVHASLAWPIPALAMTGIREIVAFDVTGNVLHAWAVGSAPVTIPAAVQPTVAADALTVTVG